MSLGNKLVGINFNPSELNEVATVKSISSDLINRVNELDLCSDEGSLIKGEAIRRIMDAQMWAVKAITFKE